MQWAAATVSRSSSIAGVVITILIAAFMLFDGVMKVLRLAPAMEGTTRLGYDASVVLPIGILALACAVLYAIPQTCVLGAILLTGYLGGATATHVRAGQPFYFPVIVGIIAWLGIYLREGRLHSLVPLRKPSADPVRIERTQA